MLEKFKRKIRRRIRHWNNPPLRKGEHRPFIFIHINKTGGTSIAKAIGLPHIRHLYVKQVISLIGEKKFNDAFVFTVIRNPWDKVVSHYKFRVQTNQTDMGNNHIDFKDWLRQTYGEDQNPFYYNSPRMFATHSAWLKDKKGVVRVKNFIRFESITEDYQKIARHIGVSEDLPHLKATKKDSYLDYHDEETVEIVRKYFKEDIERFNFEYKG